MEAAHRAAQQLRGTGVSAPTMSTMFERAAEDQAATRAREAAERQAAIGRQSNAITDALAAQERAGQALTDAQAGQFRAGGVQGNDERLAMLREQAAAMQAMLTQTDAAIAAARERGAAETELNGLLSQRARIASTDSKTLWSGNILDGVVEGYSAHSSNNITAATCIFGDFSQAILAEWGVLEVDVNPFANFAAGITGIRAFYTCDVGVRTAGAFSAASSIT
jgi:hypothetical protein